MSSRNLLAIALSLFAVAFSGGCGPCKNSEARILDDSAGWDAFGAPLGSGTTSGISLGILTADPKPFDGGAFLVRDAKIGSVSKTGRWMVVCNDDDDAPVRVTFQGDGFVIPTDCQGRRAMIDGVFTVGTVSEEEARRYFEDALGESAAARNTLGHGDEMRIVATGVRIARE